MLSQYNEKPEIQESQRALRSKHRRKSLPLHFFFLQNWKQILTKIASVVWGCSNRWQPCLDWAPDWEGSWEQGQAAREGLGNMVQACRDGIRKATAYLRLRLARDVKGSEKSFYTYRGSKRLNKENVGLMLSGVDDLVTVDADGHEVVNASFVLLFTRKVSQAPDLRDRVQGGKDLPVVEENQVGVSWEILAHTRPWDLMGGIHRCWECWLLSLQDQSIITERSWRSGKDPDDWEGKCCSQCMLYPSAKRERRVGKVKASHPLFSPWKTTEGACWSTFLNVSGRTRWLGTAWLDQQWVMPDQPGCLLWWNAYICECRESCECSSAWKAGVPRGSVLGPVLFNICFSDLRDATDHSGHRVCVWEDGAKPFTVAHGRRKKDNQHKSGQEMFRLDLRRNFLTMQTVKYESKLTRVAVLLPSLNVFKTQVDNTLCNLPWI